MTDTTVNQTPADDVELDKGGQDSRTPDEVAATVDAEGAPEVDSDDQDDEPSDEDAPDDDTSDEPDTFPRPVVENLRKENAKYRDRAKTAEARADTYARRLHAALVAADGRVADPADVEFNPDHLEDPDALAASISDLITRKPGLKAMRVSGDVGAGRRGTPKAQPVDLISLIRSAR